MPRITAIQVYELLPKKNCGACKEPSCMSLALKLLTREKTPFNCPNLTEAERGALLALLRPPVREVVIGNGDKAVKVGGEEVMYRHELKFFNPCVIAIDVSDLMSDVEIKNRIDFVKNFSVERVGQKLYLDGIAIRCASSDKNKFGNAVKFVSDNFDGPIILCSFNPEILRVGADTLKDRKPLLYAATKDNWKDVVKIAKEYNAPIAVYSQNLSELGTIASNIENSEKFDQIILDPCINAVGNGLRETINNFTMLRKSAIKGVKELGYPLMGVPAVAWVNSDDDITSSYYESYLSSIMLGRFASLLIVHSKEPWSILPLITLRQNIYTDPRTEPEAKPGLFVFGNPNENSPVIVTTNFSLTYFTVSGDLRKSAINCYLLVVSTKGLAVDTSVATGELSGSKIKETLQQFEVEKKVNHKKLVIPMLASRIRGDIEDQTGWEVLVGPRDSSQIAGFLRDNWRS